MISRRNLYIINCLLCIAACAPFTLSAQQISAGDRKELRRKADSLKLLSDSMVSAEQAPVRFRSDSIFVKTLVRALKMKHSFYYSFDSISVSQLYAPDSTFRIFTWQLKKDEYVYLQKGAIQMNTPDGSLKLFPLFDNSMFTAKAQDSVRGRNNWIGAIYYKIIQKQFNGKKYYTLLGFDDFTITSNKKWMEVLTFNNGEPVFGGPFISFKNDSVQRKTLARFSIEYKKEARTFFNYDPEKDMIIFDHLVSEGNEPANKASYIPDGDFEAFKWVNGQWVHVPLIDFEYKLTDGNFPRENMILDDKGNVNEQALEEASRRNMERGDPGAQKPGTPPAPVKKPAPKKKTN
jgi:hypothetical protein